MSIRRMMLFTLGAKIKNLIEAFKTRVFAAQGEFEAETCLDAQLTDLNNKGLLDSASFVVTPNGYEENLLFAISPNTSTADLTVTRATTGTRVNADGLIEQVPYNLIQRSEEFENALWIKNESSIISNSTISPSGVQNADSFIENTATALHQCIFNTSAASGIYTATIYAKPNGRNWLFFNIAAAANYGVWFDIQNGVVGTIQSNITSASITNAGNGWYRCIITANTGVVSPRISVTLSIGNNNTSYLGNGTSGIFIWGAQLVTGTQPRDYFPTTNRFNVPRIDYSSGSCPSILVEPQRTNLVLQSNNFNTTWLLFSGASIIPNSAISPEGIQNATTLNSSGGVNDFLYQVIPITNGVTYTNSFYIKNINSTSSKYRLVNNDENIINWSGATLVSISGTGTSSFVAVGNGWYRVSTTVASTSTSYIYRIFSDNANTSKSVYIYGAQLELGANATSYIPTTTAAVTRNADVIDNTNMSTLIGQTEGAMFIDFNHQRVNSLADSVIATISSGIINNSLLFAVLMNGDFAVILRTSGTTVIFISIPAASFTFGRKKIAISYKSGNTNLYVNGVKIGSTNTTAFTFPVTINKFNLGSSATGGALPNTTINSAAIYKTVLTDAQAIQLTTL